LEGVYQRFRRSVRSADRNVFFTEVNVVLDRLCRVHEEAGQTMAEYAVVLAVITIAVVVTLGLLSTAISTQLNSVIGIL
jgi:Flp pilus assembly pilin Flp